MNPLVQVKYRLGVALVDIERAVKALHLAGPVRANFSDEEWVECLAGLTDGRSKIWHSLDAIKRAEAAA